MLPRGIIIEIQNVSGWPSASEFQSPPDILVSCSIVETQSEQRAELWQLVLDDAVAGPGFNTNKNKVNLY